MKIGVISLGCSKNRVNTEQMMFLLQQAGYEITGETDGVDIVLVNTCGFIDSAKAEAIETIEELVEGTVHLSKSSFARICEEGPSPFLIVAGCFPERYKNDILEMLPGVDAVVGTGSFDDIVEVVERLWTEGPSPCYFGDINAPVSETNRIISTSPLWAYLKIAEGCDNRCAYCCIPDIRGKYRSRPLENIVKEARHLTNRGIQELIIVAQDVTRYGLDLYGERVLAKLLTELNNIKKLKWIRLHYLYPDEFDDELIDVIAKSDKILKYLDIPIQHINDDILTKMNRRGTGKEITALFAKLRERIDGVVLRTSLITGLPGEGEKEFNELYDFLKKTKIERVGVFAYSPEEGTPAAQMERPTKEIAEERADKIMQLQSQVMQKWSRSRVGSIIEVLPESFEVSDMQGYTVARSYAESPEIDGYIYVKDTRDSHFDFREVKVTGIKNGELIGEALR
ncbi:MAG: 30S ribosomal protein S12 methylthiotransferase RimO [Oscillospiraceae bacterium]|nr:30S ribosomal protein S12 methylthiotransferase RimO [Oscillospiraceae bacterium]